MDAGTNQRPLDEAEGSWSWLTASIAHGLRPASIATLAVVAVILAAALALLSFGVSDACNNPPPPISKPESGTPRESYCSAVQGAGTAIICVVGPLVAFALGAWGLRRSTVPCMAWALLIVVAAGANLAIVRDLRAIVIVPGING